MILTIIEPVMPWYEKAALWRIVAVLFALVAFLIKDFIIRRKKNKQLEAEMEDEYTLPPVDYVYATVLKKDIFMEKNIASVEKIVRTHQLVYMVQFLTDSGGTVEYSVPEELYDYINIGQKGILATVDGEFFDFGDGEEISI